MIPDDKLAAGDVIVLDGAIGSEIDRIGGKMDEAAWCGLANLTDPDTVRRVHESYLVSNIRRAVELAREALDRVAPDRPVAVAGSMSNHVAWLPGTVGPDPAYEPFRNNRPRTTGKWQTSSPKRAATCS